MSQPQAHQNHKAQKAPVELDVYYPLITDEMRNRIKALAEEKGLTIQEKKYFDFSSKEAAARSPADSADHFHHDRFNDALRVVLTSGVTLYILAQHPRGTWFLYWADGTEYRDRMFHVYEENRGKVTDIVKTSSERDAEAEFVARLK